MLVLKHYGKSFIKQSYKFPKSTSFLKFQKLSSSVYVNHRDTVDNNDETPFDFTPENYKKIEEILVLLYFINY